MELRQTVEQLRPLLKLVFSSAVLSEREDIAVATAEYEQLLHHALDLRTIRVLHLSGEDVMGALVLHPDCRVAEVVSVVSGRIGKCCKLSHGHACGRILSNHLTLAQQGVENGAVLHAIVHSPIMVFSAPLASAFAAVRADGSVVTWGFPSLGGDLGAARHQLVSNVMQVAFTSGAGAAIKTDGSLVTWGSQLDGGNMSSVATHLSEGVAQVRQLKPTAPWLPGATPMMAETCAQ